MLLSRMGRIGSQGLFDDARWSVYGFAWQASGSGRFWEPEPAPSRICFPRSEPTIFTAWGVWDYAHSTILEIAVEMGIPVAAMVVIAALASLFILARGVVKSKGRSRRSLAAITGIAVLSYLHSMIDFSLQIPGYLSFSAILLGCGLARASELREN